MARSIECPVCLKAEHVRKVLWGMPSGGEDLEKFYIGGCLVEENLAKYICIACDIQFDVRTDTTLGR
jgi:hypothetical protein